MEKNSRKKWIFAALAVGAGIVAVIATALVLHSRGTVASAATMRLVKTKGTVAVNDAKGKTVSLMDDLGLYSGYEVATKEQSYAWVNFDNVKLGKLDEESKIEIEKKGKDLAVYLNSGNLYFNVTETLAEDETMNIRTSTMVMGIRGTCGWVERESANEMTVFLIRGKVECAIYDEDGNVLASETLTAGKAAKMSDRAGNVTITVTDLTDEDVPDFVKDELQGGGSSQAPEDDLSESGAGGGQTPGDGASESSAGGEGGNSGGTAENEIVFESPEHRKALLDVLEREMTRDDLYYAGLLDLSGTGQAYLFLYSGNNLAEAALTNVDWYQWNETTGVADLYFLSHRLESDYRVRLYRHIKNGWVYLAEYEAKQGIWTMHGLFQGDIHTIHTTDPDAPLPEEWELVVDLSYGSPALDKSSIMKVYEILSKE